MLNGWLDTAYLTMGYPWPDYLRQTAAHSLTAFAPATKGKRIYAKRIRFPRAGFYLFSVGGWAGFLILGNFISKLLASRAHPG